MISEKYIEQTLYKDVKKLGGIALKFVSPAFTGVPDRLVLMPGAKICFVELKAPNGVLSPRQMIVHKMLRKLSFDVKIIGNKEQLTDFINGF